LKGWYDTPCFAVVGSFCDVIEFVMKKLHHIALIVDDITSKTDWYCNVYNASRLGSLFVDENQKVKVQFIKSDEIMLELLEPLNSESPISLFLKQHGSGTLYHIAYEVNDLGEAESEIRDRGGMVISRTKDGWGGLEVMFAVFIKDNEKQIVEYVSINYSLGSSI
jgi:methylmalonyl-CoA/ethylmalonyl-CoA epimerase